MPKAKLDKRALEALTEEDAERTWWVRLYRLWEPMPVLIFEGTSKLYLKKSGNKIITISPRQIVWAEGGGFDIESDGNIVVEDYMMQVYSM